MSEETPVIPGVLAIDIGNTRIHLAAVRGDEVVGEQSFAVSDLENFRRAVQNLWDEMAIPKKVAAASVNPDVLEKVEAAVRETVRQPVMSVGRDLPLPIDADLPKPEAVGVDRLCAAVAAYDRLGNACVVAGFGTAITLDCVSAEGVFLGGAILPGLGLSAAALHQRTAQLPEVKLSEPDWVFGKNTHDAIVGGLVYGARGALRYFVESYATALGHWPLVILTGGDAELVAGDLEESDLVQAIVPDLVLRGVAMAYYKSILK
jgi:type III pantothenate kinase